MMISCLKMRTKKNLMITPVFRAFICLWRLITTTYFTKESIRFFKAYRRLSTIFSQKDSMKILKNCPIIWNLFVSPKKTLFTFCFLDHFSRMNYIFQNFISFISLIYFICSDWFILFSLTFLFLISMN